MAEITITPCMRYTQVNEIPAAKRRGDKERKTERQRETGQTITVTVFDRLTAMVTPKNPSRPSVPSVFRPPAGLAGKAWPLWGAVHGNIRKYRKGIGKYRKAKESIGTYKKI